MTTNSHSYSEPRWPKVIGSAVASAAVVGGGIWGLIEMRGNDVWAPKKETAYEIRVLHEKAIRGELAASAAIDLARNTKADLVEDLLEVKQMLTEQRAVSREILKAISHQPK